MGLLEIFHTSSKEMPLSPLPPMQGTTRFSGIGAVNIEQSKSGKILVVRKMINELNVADKRSKFLKPGQVQVISGESGARLIVIHKL